MDLHTYASCDATSLAELVKKREVSPEELADAAYKQIEHVNPLVNGVVRTRQEKTEMEIKKLKLDGSQPFAGVPMLLKDISQAIEGEPLTAGSKLLTNHTAKRDSHFVARLRKAGFTFIGHTNTPEFGLRNITEPELHGATKNPWNTKFSAGGSSGGSAAAVASGMVPIAGASDGGGSIRIPASFTGLFGLKPTRGRTPVGPSVGRQWHGASIDFVLTKSVRDSAAMLDHLQVIQPEAAFHTPLFEGKYTDTLKSGLKQPLRIAFQTQSPVGTKVSSEAEEAVHRMIEWLEGNGHQVEERGNGIDGVRLMENYYTMNNGEMSATILDLEKMLGRPITANDVDIVTWVLSTAGHSVTAAEFSKSLAEWDFAAAQMAAFHETFDLYLTPATAFDAPGIGELMQTEEEIQTLLKISERHKDEHLPFVYDMFLKSLTYTPFTQLANLTGQPAMSLPTHMTKQGLPLGVQFIAPKGREDLLVSLAGEIEQTRLWIGMEGNPFF
ncbi:amidase [Metabacillus indicus]|uniref:amidase n=1 Tax=Metabacillus indicus TaxID=246786 RepID=UPI00316C65AC